MARWCFAPILVCVFIRGVVGEVMSEIEGKSFTLDTGVTKQKHDTMLWYFNGICIAMINGNDNNSCLYYGKGGRFRDRLKNLDHDTGSLTITNITSEHAGLYEARIRRRENNGNTISINGAPQCNPTKILRENRNFGNPVKTVCLTIRGVCSDGLGSVLGKVGGYVTLHTGVTKQQHDRVRWYFNNICIAIINGDPSNSCLYVGDGGIFRDRLEVYYETGSLTITNITAEHTGRYEAELISSESAGTRKSLNRTSKCDRTKVNKKTNNVGDPIKNYFVSVIGAEKARKSTEEEQNESVKGLPPGAVAGICSGVIAVLLLIVAVLGAVVYCHQQRNKRGNKERDMSELQNLKSPTLAGADVP